MSAAVADWWSGLSDMWKGLLVLIAVGAAAVSLTIGFLEYKGLPARVLINERNITELRMQGQQRDIGLQELNGKMDRMLCYQEARENGTSAAGCNR